MRELVNSKLIVTNPNDSFYSRFPLPPLGLVFLNYAEGAGRITIPKTMVPASAWTAVFLCKYGTREAISKAQLIADNLIENIFESGGMYFQSAHYYNETDAVWKKRSEDGYCEAYIRDLLLSAYALTCVYMRCGLNKYREYALKLIECAYKQQKSFSELCESTLPAFLDGAFPEFYLRTEESGNFSPVNWRVPLHLGDVIYDMVHTAIRCFGNRQETPEGDVYYIGDINEKYHNFIRQNCILNQRGIMQPTGLPYMYMAPVDETAEFTGKNLSPVYNQWGDVNWTSDTVMWAVLGITKNEGTGAKTLCENVKNIMANNFLYDVYTFEGGKDSEFQSIATQAGIFYLEALRLADS